MIIFGSTEREKVESVKRDLNETIVRIYDEAKTYHDGKWVMFPLDTVTIADQIRLLAIKRRPNR